MWMELVMCVCGELKLIALRRLKIVLEHCTTAAAVEAVKECGPNVVGTVSFFHQSIRYRIMNIH